MNSHTKKNEIETLKKEIESLKKIALFHLKIQQENNYFYIQIQDQHHSK